MNLGQTALQILKTVAPTIALAVGGPFGPIAAAAIHTALGTTTDKEADMALAGVTPDQLLALKKAENDFQTQMKSLDITEESLIYNDLANARAREIATKDNTPKIIAYMVIALVLIAEGSMFFIGQPKGVDGVVLGRILGTLDSALMLVLGYYYGSSSGSADKSDALNKIASDSKGPKT